MHRPSRTLRALIVDDTPLYAETLELLAAVPGPGATPESQTRMNLAAAFA